MLDKMFDTIIIGAGISGLACAAQLDKYHKDFLLISKDIGGRILRSEDGLTNYGAFFVCNDYYNVLSYVTIKKRIRLRDFCFHDANNIYSLYEPKLISYIPQFIKIERHLLRFRKHLHKLRRTSQLISQKMAIERDSYLNDLYMKNLLRDELEKEILQFLTNFTANYEDKLVLWDGFCRLCYNKKDLGCTYDSGKPCRYPNKIRYSMEAVGIDVNKTVKNLDFKLEWPPTRFLYSFGLICLK